MRAVGKTRHTTKKKVVAAPRASTKKKATIGHKTLIGKVMIQASTGRTWNLSSERYLALVQIIDQGLEKLYFRISNKAEDLVSADDVFARDIKEAGGKPALLLRASREKAGFSQKALADKLGVFQPDVANMEKGRRAISREMAKRLGEIFDTDYRLFL